MPEGDTVWLAASRLNAALAGATLVSADLRVPSLATVDLSGAGVQEVVPRGKHLLTRLTSAQTLHTHFGMEGSWHLYRPGARWHGGPAHEIRAVLVTADWTAVGYRLRRVDLVPTDREADLVGHLGPDLLGPDWDADLALARLRADPSREVADALRDQRCLAGIGNIYACESLFLARTDPFTPVGEVTDLEGIVATARRLLRLNAPRPSQCTTGDERRPHWVHGRRRRPCYRCGTTIQAREQGLPPRITYWCPGCQAGPGPMGSGR
jgi:endonuclease-8